MSTSTLSHSSLLPVTTTATVVSQPDDLGAARGIVFCAIAGLAFWAGVLGIFLV